MYTKIACITIVAAIVILILILVGALLPRKSIIRLIYVIIWTGVELVMILVGTISSVMAVFKERTTLSYICLAVFINYFVIVTIMVCRARIRSRRLSGKRIKS